MECGQSKEADPSGSPQRSPSTPVKSIIIRHPCSSPVRSPALRVSPSKSSNMFEFSSEWRIRGGNPCRDLGGEGVYVYHNFNGSGYIKTVTGLIAYVAVTFVNGVEHYWPRSSCVHVLDEYQKRGFVCHSCQRAACDATDFLIEVMKEGSAIRAFTREFIHHRLQKGMTIPSSWKALLSDPVKSPAAMPSTPRITPPNSGTTLASLHQSPAAQPPSAIAVRIEEVESERDDDGDKEKRKETQKTGTRNDDDGEATYPTPPLKCKRRLNFPEPTQTPSQSNTAAHQTDGTGAIDTDEMRECSSQNVGRMSDSENDDEEEEDEGEAEIYPTPRRKRRRCSSQDAIVDSQKTVPYSLYW